MTLLLGSLALLLGPFVYLLGQRRAATRYGIEGFILVTIAGIVCLHIVPAAWQIAGMPGVVFGLLGLAFPLVLERLCARAVHSAHVLVVVLAALGVVVHAIADGIALLPEAGVAGGLPTDLAMGVILHRVPVGMTIWWVLRGQFGTLVTVSAFLAILLVTALGYSLGGPLAAAGDSPAFACFQSFVAGSLVHVVIFGINHDHDEHARSRHRSRAFRVGLLLGLAALFGLPHLHP